MFPGFTDQHQSDGVDSVVSVPDSVAITDTPMSSCPELAGVADSPAFLSQVLDGVASRCPLQVHAGGRHTRDHLVRLSEGQRSLWQPHTHLGHSGPQQQLGTGCVFGVSALTDTWDTWQGMLTVCGPETPKEP